MELVQTQTTHQHWNRNDKDVSSIRRAAASTTSRAADSLPDRPILPSRQTLDNKNHSNTHHWAQPSTDYVIDPADLWEQRKDQVQELPEWMIQYFRFHKEQRQQKPSSSSSSSSQQRYLYVTCLAEYRKCGGTADRLLPLPFLIQVAASSRRIILFHWTQPALLEQFLMPPVGGLDWRVNNDNDTAASAAWLQTHSEKAGDEASIVELAHRATLAVVQVKFQSHDHGAGYYNRHRIVERRLQQPPLAMDQDIDETLEPDFATVFADLWRILFTPSAALAQQIHETMLQQQQQPLAPGQYVGAHVRALYGVSSRPEALIARMAENALHCTLQFLQNHNNPVVYVASDSLLAVQTARDYGTAHGLTVVSATTLTNRNHNHSRHLSQDPLHLDKTPDWRTRPATDFMTVFVDLYLLGSSRCVTYGMGGFGLLASFLSRTGAATCHAVHMNATFLADCPTVPPLSLLSIRNHPPQSTIVDDSTRHTAHLWSSLFLPPMDSFNES